MNAPTLLLLTNDVEFEKTALASARTSGCAMVVGHNPADAACLLARHLEQLQGAIVDLDLCTHGSAWLATLSTLSPRIPAIAVSHLDPRFLQSIAQRHGAEFWVSKPVDSERLSFALQGFLPHLLGQERTRSGNVCLSTPQADMQGSLTPASVRTARSGE